MWTIGDGHRSLHNSAGTPARLTAACAAAGPARLLDSATAGVVAQGRPHATPRRPCVSRQAPASRLSLTLNRRPSPSFRSTLISGTTAGSMGLYLGSILGLSGTNSTIRFNAIVVVSATVIPSQHVAPKPQVRSRCYPGPAGPAPPPAARSSSASQAACERTASELHTSQIYLSDYHPPLICRLCRSKSSCRRSKTHISRP